MSAWIVSRKHIDLLTQALSEGEIVVDLDPDEIGRRLWQENVKSIHARYPDTAENDDNYPGPNGFRKAWADQYSYERFGDMPSPSFLHKQVRCYDYQTCEHDDYETSEVHGWIEQLEKSLNRAGADIDSAEYDAAPWGI